MTEKESQYLKVGMYVNYSESIPEAYKERARSMVEDIEMFEDIIDHSVIMNYGEVVEISKIEKKALIKRNTFSGDATEWVHFSELRYGEKDKERIETLINRENNINDILD